MVNKKSFAAAAIGAALWMIAGHAYAASLSLSPRSGSVSVGQVFTVTIAVSSVGQAMNAASGNLSFPSDKIHAISISEEGSIIDQWVRKPSFSNSAGSGSVNFEGVVMNPGYGGNNGTLIKVVFQAVAPGNAALAFSAGSVLANDGNGTDILDSMEPGSFFIMAEGAKAPAPLITQPSGPAAPVISSVTHPDEAAWYNAKTLQLLWKLPDDVQGVSYALYSATNFTLPSESKGLLSSVSYDLTKYREGKWYFYVKFENAAAWGPVAARKVNIDFTPPNNFLITKVDGADPTDPQPVFTWSAYDALSGVSKYIVKIGEGDWFDAKKIQIAGTNNEYQLPREAPADNVVLTVDAYDQAGNVTRATTTFSVAPLPLPRVDHYSQQITTREQLFTADGVEGAQTAGTTVTVTLKKGSAVLSFSSPVDANGQWAVSSGADIPAGLWHMAVQASDARGALSLKTADRPVNVGGWFENLIGFFLGWGIALAFGLLIIAGIIALIYLIRHRLRFLHVSLDKKMIKMKEELRADLKRIEKEIESDQSGRKWARKEIEHLEADIKKDIKAIDEK